MIEYLKLTNKGIVPIEKIEKNCWINLYKPTTEEIDFLTKLLKIKKEDEDKFKEDINSLQDSEEIPILEKWDAQKIFIITRTAQKKINNSEEYYTNPLGLFITKNYIITIGFIKNDIIDQIKTKKVNYKYHSFVLKLLLFSSRVFLNYLKNIEKIISSLEYKLEYSPKNKDMKKLLNMEKSLVYFNTSLKGNQILYNRIYKVPKLVSTEKDYDIIDDIFDENKQAIAMTLIYKNIIKNILDVYSSVISNNLNKVVKILTSITIIIAIPTLVASIYGMNVSLPFQNSIYAFEIVMLISLIFTILILVILWEKKWL
jgi:magnesium transporter